MLSYEYCKISKNTYFEEHLPIAASVWSFKILDKYFFLGIWMFLPNLFELEYIWIFSAFKMGIFIEKKNSFA